MVDIQFTKPFKGKLFFWLIGIFIFISLIIFLFFDSGYSHRLPGRGYKQYIPMVIGPDTPLWIRLMYLTPVGLAVFMYLTNQISFYLFPLSKISQIKKLKGIPISLKDFKSTVKIDPEFLDRKGIYEPRTLSSFQIYKLITLYNKNSK